MQLREALDQARRDHQDRERSLLNQLDDHQNMSRSKEQDLLAELEQARNQVSMQGYAETDVWKDRCEKLDRELTQQRKLTDEVREDTAKFLHEMREMSQKSIEAVEKEEKLLDQIVQLEREVRVWKSRYTKAKSQARSLRSSSLGLPMPNNTAADMARDSAYIADNGCIRDIHLTNFQVTIDDLLQQARTADPTFISESMKLVIMAVRDITNDMETATSSTDAEDTANKRSKLRSRLSQAANNLISATKAHGASNGLAPVSIVDAATLHLTTAVVEIVKLLKIRQSSPEELAREEFSEMALSARPAPLSTRLKNTFSNSSGASDTHVRNASVSSAGFSNYSRYSSRYSTNTSPDQLSAEMKGGLATPQILGMLRENGIEEFKNYLEDSTALLVRSIQPLVNTIRNGGGANDAAVIADYVREIDSTVQDIVAKTNVALADLKDPALTKHAPPVVNVLQTTVQELRRTQVTQQLGNIPPLAFKVARATKQLVLRVDRIETGEVTADMTLPNDF
jgi:G protein-coupled receptor kinase-interacting protein 1